MPLEPKPSHPTSLVFVLKLHRNCRPDQALLHGRIEHLSSGRQVDFDSGDDLLRCLARLSQAPTP